MKFILTLTFALLFTGAFGQKISQKEVYDKIIELGIQQPVIVLKQAIHESGHFKSTATVKRNNIFGLRNGQMRFDDIDSCIAFYKKWQDNRYKGGDYYQFLRRIGYHRDAQYKKKVNNIKLDFIIE